ncbi:MAG: nucleoside triphosphate pyrophosphohydrolase [Chloroflexi bacterium]|nr:nucleoside triphosphate pyrophosphohydrolase [Chloroflexota bacterium]
MAHQDAPDGFSSLVDIIARLRGPSGCPWDKEQTHASLKPSLLEECYEVLEAIDAGDGLKLSEELGDLLMHIVLHAQIAREEGQFTIDDVVQGISDKLVHRHPHVFGGARVSDARDVALSWESLKQKERGTDSVLASLPQGMPALARSQALQRRAARVGFDWKEIGDVIAKLGEEVRELQEVADQGERVREFGDLLFALVNAARWLDVDSEEALRMASERFSHRFAHMEGLCRRRGLALSGLSLEEQDKLWEEAKKVFP